jgi:hypothetical protein
MIDQFGEGFQRLVQFQNDAAAVHPTFLNAYPVALVEDQQFLIYDRPQVEAAYELIKTAPVPMPVPEGVQAAFPLDVYDGKMAAVVTPAVFDSPDGLVTILHEFVHCYQFSTCEQDLKMSLDITKCAQETGDTMWEIEYPFPYTAMEFVRGYGRFLDGLRESNAKGIEGARENLRAYLSLHDLEYMVWQEWKEGLARWVENRLQRELGLAENKGGTQPPYGRVSFYASGAAYISHLSAGDPLLVNDLPKLFSMIYNR